jgi:branched-subunit amino acid transport protein
VTWLTVALLAAVCVFMRVAVPLGLGDRQPEWFDRALTAALPALLAALVVAGTVGNGQALEVDPRLGGVAAGGVAAIARAPLLVVVLVAAGVTAALRALGA